MPGYQTLSGITRCNTYSTHIFNVLPVKSLVKEEEMSSTLNKLITGRKPLISHFKVFGCLTIIRRWVSAENTKGKQTECGNSGIFIGFN
jgi:hypothetical protein